MRFTIKGRTFTEFTYSYLGTALWSSLCLLPVTEDELVDGCMDVDDEHPLHGVSENDHYDAHFDHDDFTEESLGKASHDCQRFMELLINTGLYDEAIQYQDDDTIAHDFWLTRNGHGAGFWDGDYGTGDNCVGDRITTLIKDNFAEQHIWINDDGSLEIGDG